MVQQERMTRRIESEKVYRYWRKTHRKASKAIEAIAAQHKINAMVSPVFENPYLMGDADRAAMHHWAIELERRDDSMATHTMGVFFSTGKLSVRYFFDYRAAPTPTPGLVIESLLGDIVGVEGYGGMMPMRDWATDMGANPDDIAVIRTWQTIYRHDRELRAFLGPDIFEQFMATYREQEGID